MVKKILLKEEVITSLETIKRKDFKNIIKNDLITKIYINL